MPVPECVPRDPRPLLRDDAYRAIRDAIVDGRLAPGEQLNDGVLAQWLGVSRTPVREALTRLEDAGLVHTKPGRYTIVSPLDVRACRAAQSVTMAMHEIAVREAFPRLGTADFDAMRQANARFAGALRADDVDAAIAADDQFHGVAVTVSGNTALRTVLEQFTPLLRRFGRLRFTSVSGQESVVQHERIVAACEAGEVEAAVATTRANWQSLSVLLDTAVDDTGQEET